MNNNTKQNYLDDLNNLDLVKRTFILINYQISKMITDLEKNLDDFTLTAEQKLNICKVYAESFISNVHELITNLKQNRPAFKLYIQEQINNSDNDLVEFKYNIGSGTSNEDDYIKGNLPDLIPFMFKFKYDNLNLYLPGLIILYNPINCELSVKISFIDTNKELNIKNSSNTLFKGLPLSEINTKVYNILPNISNIDLSESNHINFIENLTRLNNELINFGLFFSGYTSIVDLKYESLKKRIVL